MFWQECAEAVACEECAPLDGGHMAATPGRVFVSAQCIVISNADVDGHDLQRSPEGLVQCTCGFIVGETQRTPSTSANPLAKAGKRSTLKLNLRAAYGSASFCRNAGLSSYKHRVAALPSASDRITDGQQDLLADFSEEAAVTAQLLVLRETQGASRFMLLPARPAANGKRRQEAPASAEALELRLVVRDLLVVGPVEHSGVTSNLQPEGGPEPSLPSADARLRRMVKVYYRRCACTNPSQQCVQMGIPQMSFDAVLRCLDRWVSLLPASQALSPVAATDGAKPWLTSLLPLPPDELGDP